MSFYNIFVFTPPYESFIPSEGADTRLQFPDGEANPCNQALIKYRNEIGAFITHYQKLHIATPAQEFQWPLCIET